MATAALAAAAAFATALATRHGERDFGVHRRSWRVARHEAATNLSNGCENARDLNWATCLYGKGTSRQPLVRMPFGLWGSAFGFLAKVVHAVSGGDSPKHV